MSPRDAIPVFPWRRIVVLALVLGAVGLLTWRAVYLQVVTRDFLRYQGDARHLRVVAIPAHRGMITDRGGEPLAISTPVHSVWANPQELGMQRGQLGRLARELGLEMDALQRLLAERATREFVYLKRQVNPDVAARVMELAIPGVFLQREYKRYYPAGEVAAHVVGFTDIDDTGREGIELAYDDWLSGEPGAKRVIKDRLGRIVEDVESIRPARPGKDLALSIDRRVQYLAYRELKQAMAEHDARSGSLVVLDVTTGEVLAMVNQPSYNSNNRRRVRGERLRNRAVTDVFEPGSTVKPFTVAAALTSGQYHPHSPVDTAPGFLRVGPDLVRDMHDYGALDLSGVITKSSNVGAAKIALSLEPEHLWRTFTDLGFGQVTGSGFPGEASGLLADYHRWYPIERATLSFGYGLSVTPLQLAQAYGVLAADGVRRPVSFLRLDAPPPATRVLPVRAARELRAMLETVIGPEGTGQQAAVTGYRVAGKTGTVHKSTAGGYADDRYVSVFAGFAPATRPRLAAVVMINEPGAGKHFGGQVAAPVFARVMAGSLRLLAVPPDDLPEPHHPVRMAQGEVQP